MIKPKKSHQDLKTSIGRMQPSVFLKCKKIGGQFMGFDANSQIDLTRLYSCYLTKYLMEKESPWWKTQTSKRFSTSYSPDELGKGLKTELDEVPPVRPTVGFN